MINAGDKILKAWYELLNGNISIPVYRTDVSSDQDGNYLLLRIESATQQNNNQKFVTFPVLITEVVTKFLNKIDDSLVYSVDSEVGALLYSSTGKHNLPAQSGIQIASVTMQNQTTLPEDNGATPKINRLITRWSHRVEQLT